MRWPDRPTARRAGRSKTRCTIRSRCSTTSTRPTACRSEPSPGAVPGAPEPPRTDFSARELNQFLWDQQVDFPFLFALRAELEFRAGGNPSWNTDVDYDRQLAQSINRDEVRALYRAAGLDLQQD